MMNYQNIMFGFFAPMEKAEERKMKNNMFWWMMKNNCFDGPLSTYGILFIYPK